MIRVLLIDDEPLLLDVLAKKIRWDIYGMQIVATANDGVKALEYLKRNEVDVIFSDIKMPLMGGVELLKRVHPFCPQVLFVMLSAYSDFELVKESFQLGAVDYILKIDIDNEKVINALLRKLRIRYDNAPDANPREPTKLMALLPESALDTPHCCRVIAIQTAQRRNILSLTEGLAPLCTSRGDMRLSYEAGAVCVIICAPTGIEAERLTQMLLQRIREYRQESAGAYPLRIGLGDIQPAQKIADSCRNALAILFYTGMNEMRRYEPRSSAGCESLYSETVRMIKQSVDSDSFPQIRANIDQMLIESENAVLDPDRLRNYTATLFHSLYDNIWDPRSGQRRQEPESALSMDGFLELKTTLNTVLTGLSETIGGKDAQTLAILVKTHIDRNYADPSISISKVAKAIGCSSRYVGESIRCVTGMHFKQYLNELRLKRAIILMTGSELRVGEISQSVGYTSVEHFSRIFSQKMGVSPLQYKKQHTGDTSAR